MPFIPYAVVSGGGDTVLTDYDVAVLADSPVAYWRLDVTGGAITDLQSGRLDIAVLPGSTAPTYRVVSPTPSGYAMTFPAAGCRFGRAASTSLSPTDNFSVEAWINFATTGVQWLYRTGSGGVTRGWGIGVFTSNQMGWVANNAGVGNGTAALSASTWYLLVWVRDGGTWKSYINGSPDSTNMGSATPGAIGAGDFMALGGDADGASSTVDATIASLAVYNTVLSPATVAAHYAAA